ncbi:hypothetical protein [Paenibacillus physcomitrellae]|uniref:hypothetical protein n=1 Tax=Paenibacillus physcomitrellae TaxID=1619311 RepID=UPI00166732A7|nr:hypothetical protein [Paenibacillus physcomitrellae]
MSNQFILWATFVIPWGSLIFMKKDSIRRYLPAGLLSAFLSILVCEIGVGSGWWTFRETTYPLGYFSTYVYGLFPVVPMWILYFTYKRFWLFFGIEVVANLIFAFVILRWFSKLGIVNFNKGWHVFIAEVLITLIFYAYQRWQDAAVREGRS